ncbi:MAG: hypothetical protein ABIH41_02700, partial [Nanoarchaeota archaeon]
CGEDGCGLAGNWLKGETKSLSVSCPGLTADDRVLLSVVMSHDSEGRPVTSDGVVQLQPVKV